MYLFFYEKVETKNDVIVQMKSSLYTCIVIIICPNARLKKRNIVCYAHFEMNGHRVKLVRKSLYIDGQLYISPALAQDDSDQAENTGHETNYALVTKVDKNTTPLASQKQRYNESD